MTCFSWWCDMVHSLVARHESPAPTLLAYSKTISLRYLMYASLLSLNQSPTNSGVHFLPEQSEFPELLYLREHKYKGIQLSESAVLSSDWPPNSEISSLEFLARMPSITASRSRISSGRNCVMRLFFSQTMLLNEKQTTRILPIALFVHLHCVHMQWTHIYKCIFKSTAISEFIQKFMADMLLFKVIIFQGAKLWNEV